MVKSAKKKSYLVLCCIFLIILCMPHPVSSCLKVSRNCPASHICVPSMTCAKARPEWWRFPPARDVARCANSREKKRISPSPPAKHAAFCCTTAFSFCMNCSSQVLVTLSRAVSWNFKLQQTFPHLVSKSISDFANTWFWRGACFLENLAKRF